MLYHANMNWSGLSCSVVLFWSWCFPVQWPCNVLFLFTNKKQSKPLQRHWTKQREDQRILNGLSFRPSLSHEMCTLKITQSIDLYACGCCNNNVHHLLRFWVLLSLNARHNSGMKKSTALCKVLLIKSLDELLLFEIIAAGLVSAGSAVRTPWISCTFE